MFNYNTDGTVIVYQQTFDKTNCAGDVVFSKIYLDYSGGCYSIPNLDISYGAAQKVSSMGCASQTGYSSQSFATSDDCSNPDKAFRCQSFINNYCAPSSAGGGIYEAKNCGGEVDLYIYFSQCFLLKCAHFFSS